MELKRWLLYRLKDVKMAKICLGMAVSDYIRSRTAGMMFTLAQKYPDMKLIIHQGPYVHQNRENVARDFLQTDCTHLFFVDSDMLFKPEVLDSLIKSDKDVIGAQYYRRVEREGVPVVNTRYNMPGMSMPNHPFVQSPLATGCLLIKREVFEKVPAPWFAVGLDEAGAWVGEDVFFSRKVGLAGIQMWMDGSLEVKHIGEHLY